MKKTVVIYGSSTGTTQNVAVMIAGKLGVGSADVFDVCKISPEILSSYEVLILGTSTWGYGELQDDWYSGVAILKETNLEGKTVALFGCGDSESYPETFCDGMGLLYEELKDTGCRFVGDVDESEYSYSSSVSVIDGRFVGLAIDEMNESDRTAERVEAWVKVLKKEFE